MGVKERREREKLETREKILDAARELFIAEGYDGVSSTRRPRFTGTLPTRMSCSERSATRILGGWRSH